MVVIKEEFRETRMRMKGIKVRIRESRAKMRETKAFTLDNSWKLFRSLGFQSLFKLYRRPLLFRVIKVIYDKVK